MRWKKYELKHDVWQNLFELNNAMKLIKKYENVIEKIINRLSDRLLLKNKFNSLKNFASSKFFVSFSSKQKKFATISIKKIFIDKSRLFRISQKTLISWNFFHKVVIVCYNWHVVDITLKICCRNIISKIIHKRIYLFNNNENSINRMINSTLMKF